MSVSLARRCVCSSEFREESIDSSSSSSVRASGSGAGVFVSECCAAVLSRSATHAAASGATERRAEYTSQLPATADYKLPRVDQSLQSTAPPDDLTHLTTTPPRDQTQLASARPDDVDYLVKSVGETKLRDESRQASGQQARDTAGACRRRV